MTFQCIFGKDTASQSAYYIQEIVESQNTEKRIFVLVPEQFTLEMERIFLHASKGALTTVQVVSFKRLAYWVFSKMGAPKGVLLDDLGAFILLSKAMADIKDTLLLYQKGQGKAGFIKELAAQMDEFNTYQIGKKHLDILVEKLDEGPASQHMLGKVRDIREIYSQFLAVKEASFITDAEILTIMADKISGCDFLQGTTFLVDRFNGFTPQEFLVLEKLMEISNIKFSLLEPAHHEKTPLFETIEGTKKTLEHLATTKKMHILAPIYLPKTPGKPADLEFLSNNIFTLEKNIYHQSPKNITVIEGTHKFDEANQVASQIITLIGSGLRYRDIAVIASDPSYYPVIENVFSSYEIPIFIDQRQDILFHPLVKLVESIFDVKESYRSYIAVVQLLKTGLLPISPAEIYILENYMLAYGIRGKKWEKSFIDIQGNIEKETNINNMREKMLLIFSIIETLPETANAIEFSQTFVDILLALGATEALEIWLQKTAITDPSLFQIHEQMWDKVMEVFQVTARILATENVSLETFKHLIKAGLEANHLGVLPPTLDQIIVGDVYRSRLHDIKALCIMGANEGFLPPKMESKGLFSDIEKEKAEKLGIAMGERVENAYEAYQLLLWQNISKPQEKIILSYSLLDIAGTHLEKATVVDGIIEIFPSLLIEKPIDFLPTHPKPLFGNLMAKASQKVLTGKERMYLEYFLATPPYTEKIKKIEMALSKDEKTLYLQTPRVSKRFKSSVSRLEKFAACPFSYFATYDLRLRERAVLDVKAVDVGNMYHGVLENLGTMILESQRDWKDIDDQTLEKFSLMAIEKEASKQVNQVLETSHRFMHVKEKIKEISLESIKILTKHMKESDFSLHQVEHLFAASTKNELEIILEHGQMWLEGKIDRIDLFQPDGKNGDMYVKLIDYKSGSADLVLTDVFLGIQIQLLIYMQAIMKDFSHVFADGDIRNILPGALLYFKIHHPRVEEDGGTSKNNQLEREKSYKMGGLVLNDTDLVFALDKVLAEKNGYSAIGPMSSVINRGQDKKETPFSVGKSDYLVTPDEFQIFMDFAAEKAKELGSSLQAGLIDKKPYRKGTFRPCSYCPYHAICQFDPILDRQKERVLSLTNKEARMKIFESTTLPHKD